MATSFSFEWRIYSTSDKVFMIFFDGNSRMGITTFIHAVFDPTSNVFVVNSAAGSNRATAMMAEDEFRTFVQTLSNKVTIDNLTLSFDNVYLARMREYLELVLSSYENWKSKNAP